MALQVEFRLFLLVDPFFRLVEMHPARFDHVERHIVLVPHQVQGLRGAVKVGAQSVLGVQIEGNGHIALIVRIDQDHLPVRVRQGVLVGQGDGKGRLSRTALGGQDGDLDHSVAAPAGPEHL